MFTDGQDARNPPLIINVIDQNPRIFSLLPPKADIDSTLRLKVITRAKVKASCKIPARRVVLCAASTSRKRVPTPITE